jgi:hypothetical protein
MYVSNNTISGCGLGLDAVSFRAVARNNIFDSISSGGKCVASAGPQVMSDYNLCNLPGEQLGNHSRAGVSASFVDASAQDLHLSPTDTAATGQGIDLSADWATAFAVDIDGDPRTVPWDIGADQH